MKSVDRTGGRYVRESKNKPPRQVEGPKLRKDAAEKLSTKKAEAPTPRKEV